MIRQFLSGIIAHNLLGERQFPIEMILIRILRRLPRRRPRPRKHFLGRPPEPRPRRRDIPCALTILGPLLIIPPRLIRIRRHMLPRNRNTIDAREPTHRSTVVELPEPLQRSSRLRRRHPPHAPTGHTRITFSPTHIHTVDFPAHIRERPGAHGVRTLGDSRQFTPRTPILTAHRITQIIQLTHNITGGPPIILAGRPSPPSTQAATLNVVYSRPLRDIAVPGFRVTLSGASSDAMSALATASGIDALDRYQTPPLLWK